MKLLVVTHHSLAEARGGAEAVTNQLVDRWRASGHYVEVLSFDDLPTWFSPRLQTLIFPWYVALRLATARKPSVDAIDASTGDTWLWATLRRPGIHRKAVLLVRSHGLEPLFEDAMRRCWQRNGIRVSASHRLYWGWWRQWEVRRSLSTADRVRVLNSAERLWVDTHIRHPRVIQRGNAVPSDLLTLPRLRRAGVAHIVSVGAWEVAKGSRDIAAAFAQLPPSLPAQLTLLGARAAAADVKRDFPQEWQARLTVLPTFERSQVGALLAEQDIYLSASWSEGSSIALLEALAMGCVPVVTDVGEAPELVSTLPEGRLVKPGAPGDLATALKDVVGALEHGRAASGAIRAEMLIRSNADARVTDLRDLASDQ